MGSDIYSLLIEEGKKRRQKEKIRLIKSLGIQIPLFFEEGKVRIDESTCEGLDCRACVDICPTHALYWKQGKVKVIEDLCIYCVACVLICPVDDCIRVTRKRNNGKIEKFSTPREVLDLIGLINSNKRFNIVKSLYAKKPYFMSEDKWGIIKKLLRESRG